MSHNLPGNKVITGWGKLYSLVLMSLAMALAQTSFSQSTHYDTLSFDGKSRSYIVYVPQDCNGKLCPLMLNLHGWTSNGQQQLMYSQMNMVADTAGFIVAYPNAINNTWNAGLSAQAVSNEKDVGFLSALIDTLARDYGVDTCNVFSAGMSLGGFMSYRLACELSERIKAIASVTGLMSDSVYNDCPNFRAVPILQMHGTDDGTVYYEGLAGHYSSVDSTIGLWVGKNECDTSPTVTSLPDIDPNDGSTVTTYHYNGGLNDSEVILYKVINGGHTWPGGAFNLPGEVTNRDIHASGEIWNFFRKFLCPQTGEVFAEQRLTDFHYLKIYPNPSSGIFTLDFRSLPEKLMVYSIDARVVFEGSRIGERTYHLDLSDQPAGIYFLKAVDQDHQTWVKKLVIQ